MDKRQGGYPFSPFIREHLWGIKKMNQSNMIVNLPITNFLAKKLSVLADGTVFVYGILQQDITGLLRIAYDKFRIDGFIGQRSGENVMNLRIKKRYFITKNISV